MVCKQNELKFLINGEIHLSKSQHVNHVCEAYYGAQKTWFAALIQDVDEIKQEAEIAWIGYNKQEKSVPKSQITILKQLSTSDLFVGAHCNSVCGLNGMWFPCVIEKEIIPSQADEMQMLETGDFRLLQNKYQVKFTGSGEKETVTLDFIRITKD
jgi:hypothetical protein